MNTGIEFTMKLSAAYSAVCRPLCHELNLPQTAFDILMFLANNPEYTTARDIVEVRKIKANLVSINVDKLVGEGYLRREADTDDRREDPSALHRQSRRCHRTGAHTSEPLYEQSSGAHRRRCQKAARRKYSPDGAESGSHVRGGTLI